ncbi:RNA-directed DNA polymerase, eukaryota, reverse transcriptase zinc-binding domain protein [Tanacetum coccineum]
MDNSKRGSIPMQVDLHLNKSQCATTSAEMKQQQVKFIVDAEFETIEMTRNLKLAVSNPNPNRWTWVFRKNNKQHSKPIDDPFVKDVDKFATSFYISNFPNSLDTKNLWKEFQPFGRIVDAFITNKQSKQAEDCMSMGRVCIATKVQSLIYEKVEVNILGKTFQVFVKEIGTWNIYISNYIESNDSDNEDILSSGNVDPNEALDDFIQHVVEEKEAEKTPPQDPKADDSKPPSFEKGLIYNNDDVTSRAGKEDVSFSTDQVKDNHTLTHKGIVANEVVLDNSKPPGFENFIKENKAFFGHLVLQEQASRALGYDVKGCKKSLRRLINGIDDGHATDVDRTTRINRMQELKDLEKLESMDLVQKSRVKLDVEGDENSKFFHGLINSRRKSQMVQGIMLDGVWNSEHKDIKSTFLDF